MTHVTRRRYLAALGSGALGTAALGPAVRASRRPDAEAFGAEAFGAWLTGANEVPPVETDAFGFAGFRLARDRSHIDYRLVVAGIENVEESHVHKGPPDLNGNVVAYLFGPAQDPVDETGLLASGRLTDDDMIWPLTDVAGMAEQMRAANVYVNVHTTAHPSGEIRGQIRPLSLGDGASASAGRRE
ncbi:CHRD domain-containing protein [Halorussus gelatinilyticus]|uniref:CHRD domain-containing protein n=1 Tax=Halorussus gelatinilyticus TaxID=2937524 RepID=A0A8U0IGY7_9EURY|nr:CHRD domain-containing protein [Halorussus gelatinilyticus]UPW00337.1 CHRD domain-containing protein [Halorussus gelatinilyticus]